MTPTIWLTTAIDDAEWRDLPALRPLLEALAGAIQTLRQASWNHDAAGSTAPTTAPAPDGR